MTFLSTEINNLNNPFLEEQLHERIELIAHKIKFMDKLPIVILDSSNKMNSKINAILELSGAYVVDNIEEAVYALYFEEDKNLNELIRIVPPILNQNSNAFKNNRIILLTDQNPKNAEEWVNLTEDIAEIIHPGYFVFGNEDISWIRFQC